MRALAYAFLLAGCLDQSSDGYPVIPGGGGPPPVGAPSGSSISGRVCMSDDLITTNCATSGVGGLNVSIGGESTTTADDGTFSVAQPSGSLLAFTVSGPGAVTTTTPYSPSTTIPVINADVWATTMASNNITLPAGSGSILGTVSQGGAAATGVTVTSTPTSSFGPFYDGETGFALNSTGARGVFLIPGVTAGATNLAFTPGETQVAGISVINGGVTVLDSMTLP